MYGIGIDKHFYKVKYTQHFHLLFDIPHRCPFAFLYRRDDYLNFVIKSQSISNIYRFQRVRYIH